MSFSALSSLTVHRSTSFWSCSFFRVFSASSASITASLSVSSLSSACLARRPTITSSYSASANLRLARFGATTLATRSYLLMAMHHLHMPSAAEEAFAAFSGVQFSSVM